MAEKVKKFLNVDTKKKVITIDNTAEPEKNDFQLLTSYLAAGYTKRDKSEKRTKTMKQRAENDKELTVENMREALKDDEKNLKTFEAILKGKDKGHGYFAAKSWYKKEILKQK